MGAEVEVGVLAWVLGLGLGLDVGGWAWGFGSSLIFASNAGAYPSLVAYSTPLRALNR